MSEIKPLRGHFSQGKILTFNENDLKIENRNNTLSRRFNKF